MSVHAVSWAFRQKVGDAGAKLVLIKLADQANDRGECFPSYRTLGTECEMSLRTVQRKIELLSKSGLITVEARTRENGSSTSNLYRIGGGSQSDTGEGDSGDVPPMSPVTPPEPSLEPTSPVETGEGDADAPHARDEIWDFLEEQFGRVDPKARNAHQKRNRAAADLRALGATPDELRSAVQSWSRQFVGATLTDIALATHFPQLRPSEPPSHGRSAEPVAIDEAAVASARLSRAAGEISQQLKRGVCDECGVGGGKHMADCAQARELPRQAYTRFIEETADFPIEEVDAVISTWRDLDDVERQHFRDLADEIRATRKQEAA